MDPRTPAFLLIALLAGCPSSGTPDDDDSTTPANDDDLANDDDSASGGVLLTGDASRTVDLVGDGIGTLVVALFSEDPGGAGGDPGEPVAFGRFAGSDLIDPDSTIPYGVGGIPFDSGTLYVGAFFDEDDPDGALKLSQPDEGDLINFDLSVGGAPTVEIGSAEAVVFDVVLNQVVSLPD